MTAQQNQLKKLIGLAGEAATKNDMDGMLTITGEIAALRKSMEAEAKAERERKLQENAAVIMKLQNTVCDRFDEALAMSAREIAELGELGSPVEMVKYQVDYTVDPVTKIRQFGPKKAQRATSGGGNGHSKRNVTCADGSVMDTRSFVEKFASDEERGTKTFEKWPTALAEKIAKRESATIA